MKNTSKILVFAIFLLFPLSIFAQKFGHLNSTEIIQSMPEKDSVVAKLQRINKELTASYQAMNEELISKEQKFVADKDNMTDLIKKTRQEEIQQLQQRMQQFKENANDEIQKDQTEMMQPVIEKVKNAIAAVGKENGFLIIFDIEQGTNILYFSSDSHDVTSLVKSKLGLK